MTSHDAADNDVRLEQLRYWLNQQYSTSGHSTNQPLDYQLAPASADASFRRYFRITIEDKTQIVMDAPPTNEDCRPFIKVAGLLQAAGVHVPEIIAQDVEQGFLLLSDLGRQTYLDAINRENAQQLFGEAADALIKWQLASRPDVLPPYDEALLRRELNLFPEWYVAKHRGITLSATQRQTMEQAFDLIVRACLAQPSAYVHRDYMPRNLMISTPNPGVLDFQDAVYGPITYDVASLFRDAFISWEEDEVLDGVIRYWEKARRAGLPVQADFGDYYRDLEWMGLQRHLKVLGIFARIHYRDGKPKYLADTPRFIAYVRHACKRYVALTPLLRLVDVIEGESTVQTGYTF